MSLPFKIRPYEDALFSIYDGDVDAFLLPFLSSKSLLRLEDCGMNCGLEYTDIAPYNQVEVGSSSRLSHSLGVALIAYHFSHDKKVALAGLFHDISTPCFAHVIDFLEGDYLTQEKTEEGIGDILRNDEIISSSLKDLGIDVGEVEDYHLYAVADNPSPKLSADRLEYTLRNFISYGNASLEETKHFYNDLMYDETREELVFVHKEFAEAFAFASLKNSWLYVDHPDRYSMEALSRILKTALRENVIEKADLWSEEKLLISKLESNDITKEMWQKFRATKRVFVSEAEVEGSFKVFAKKRYIDPYVLGLGRVSEFSPSFKKKLQEFLSSNQDIYIFGR